MMKGYLGLDNNELPRRPVYVYADVRYGKDGKRVGEVEEWYREPTE